MCTAASFCVAAIEATLDAMSSCHKPSRAKICAGMCSACGADGASCAYLGGAVREHADLRMAPQLLPGAHGRPPVRDRAPRIIVLDWLELLLSFFVPARMQHSHASSNAHLRRRTA